MGGLSISLWGIAAEGSTVQANQHERGTMTWYPAAGDHRAAAWVICPGGGYVMRACHEGEAIAKWLNRLGMTAFVLNYSVHPHRFPTAQLEAARAIRLLRYHAEEWRIASSHIGIMGFSAGGHLAAGAGTRYDLGQPDALDPVNQMSSRPDALILSYPVITFLPPHAHEGSVLHLLGNSCDEEMRRLLSHERHVTSDTPMTFIWHTADDEAVPAANSIAFAEALKQHGVPHELCIYESGPHGLGLASGHPHASEWTTHAEAWLKRQGWR